MEELAKHKLTFAQAKRLINRCGKETIKVFFVYQRGQEFYLDEWIFDKETGINKEYILDLLSIKDGWTTRFDVGKSTWCNAGFLNYFHAYGYLQLVRARQHKEVTV